MSTVRLNRSSSRLPPFILTWQRTIGTALDAIARVLHWGQMSVTRQPPGIERNPEKRRAPSWHYLALFLIPLALWLINPNWCFQSASHYDPWYYFGEFVHGTKFDTPAAYYPTERVIWNAPGYVLVHLFGQIPGIIILHVTMFLLSVYLLHYILRQLTDDRTAFLGALMLGSHPFFIGANGWDYPEGLAIALVFLSFAFVVKASSATDNKQVYIFLSAMAWFGLIYTHIAWLMLTPAYLYVALRAVWEGGRFWRTITGIAMSIASAGLVATALLWGVYLLMGGSGFFYRHNILLAIEIGQLQNNPWLYKDWYRAPSWLVFPALAALLGFISVAFRFSRPPSVLANAVLHFNLLCVALMVILTLRPSRLLAFDYRASILMPGAFLTLGLVGFRVPESLRNYFFYPLSILSAAICVLPLTRQNLYQIAHYWQYLIPIFISIVALSCARMLRFRVSWMWAATVMLLCALSFPLVPLTPGAAWRAQYRGLEFSERVGRAVRAIGKVIPPGRAPLFWINSLDDRLTLEYRSIMCSFMAHNISMTRFPEVDPDKHLVKSQIIILITEDKDVVAAAEHALDRVGVKTSLVKQDPVAYGEESYWITYLNVVAVPLSDFASSLSPESDGNLIRNGRFDFGVNSWDREQGILRSIADCHHNGHCVQFVSQGGSNQRVIHLVEPVLHPGLVYNFSAWIKSGTATPQPVEVGIWDSIASRWAGERNITATNQWQNIHFQFTNDSSDPMLVEFRKSTVEPDTLVIDEVALKEAFSRTDPAGENHGAYPFHPASARAVFVRMDTSTQGNWNGVFGHEGYVMSSETSNPIYVKPLAAGQTAYTWTASTKDVRALQKASNPLERVAGCWYSASSLSLDLPFTDAGTHQLALYLLDWDTVDRREKVEILDAEENILDSRTLAESFHGGVYLMWNVSGHVKISLTLTHGANLVLSGLFFDRPGH